MKLTSTPSPGAQHADQQRREAADMFRKGDRPELAIKKKPS
jgi:hypothetical protein